MAMTLDITSVNEQAISNQPLRDGLGQLRGTPAKTIRQPSRSLPRLHQCCYEGDLAGVLQCITDGCSLHETIALKNQQRALVCGVTPLFLAAQRGYKPVCKLLIENGANPTQPCYIQGTTELCTPAEVAQLNLHLLLAHYLRKQVSKRKAEDAVLALDDEPNPQMAGSTAGSVYSLDFGGGSLFGGRRRLGAQSLAVASIASADTPASLFMQELDLSRWDPSHGEKPVELNAQQMTKLMKKKKIDLNSWQPDSSIVQEGSRSRAQLEPSRAADVRAEEQDLTNFDSCDMDAVGPCDGSAAVLAAGPPQASADNSRILSQYLQELDLQSLEFGQ